MDCTFVEFDWSKDGSRMVRCSRCGFTSPSPLATPLPKIHRNCDKMGLGDRIAAGLHIIGFVRQCGACNQRQEILNEFGKSIGL